MMIFFTKRGTIKPMVKSEALITDLKENKNLRQTLSDIRKAIREGDDTIGKDIVSDRDSCLALVHALDSEDAKSRKSAALLIGELPLDMGEKDQVMLFEALVDAYRSEDRLFVRESYLKSVKNLGGAGILSDSDAAYLRERLGQIDSGTFPEEDMKHILAERKQLIGLLDDGTEKKAAVFIEPDSFGALLVPVKGLYEPLKEELSSHGIVKGFSAVGALIGSDDLPRVRDIRLYSHLMYRIRGTFTGRPETMREEISQSDFLRFIRRTTRPDDKVSVRIVVHERKDHHTDAAKRFTAEFLYLFRDRLVNTAPYDMELHFYPRKSGGYILFVNPLGMEDERFSYVMERLSTSMQPVKAAIFVYLIRKYLREDARVADIFSGNGTLLLERDEYIRTHVMFATDTNQDAISAGKKNAARKGRNVYFVRRSAFTFESDEPFDEIISELPDLYEKSESDRADFFAKTAAATERLLSEHGHAFYLAGGSEIKAMIRKSEGLSFCEEIPFDDNRSIYVIERV